MFNRVIIFLLFGWTVTAQALDLELTQGINSALPIAIQQFSQTGKALDVDKIIANDLRLSGQFRLVSSPDENNTELTLASFRRAGADTLLRGHVKALENDRYEISIELIDAVNQGKILHRQSYQIFGRQLRQLAHYISDQVYYRLTGERGVFSTKIAYVLVKQKQGKKQFSLEVADADGYRPHSLLISSEPIMSPSWSPNGQLISYVSFEKKRAQIYTVNIETGFRRLITSFSGINGAPAWSPKGDSLAVVLSKSGNAQIYEVSLKSGKLTQLTFGQSIDTEPSYSPDGKYLIFTSGRGGSPQIYRLELASGKTERLTYDGNYNASASYTPDQKHIVMLHREASGFNIAIQDVNRSSVQTLTSSYMNESPSVSPNGRLVIYATRQQERGMLAMVSTDGRIRLKLPAREGDVQEPAWSPFLGVKG